MYVCVYISYDIVLYLFKMYIFIYCLYFIYILHHLIFMLSILIVGPSIFFYNFSSLIFFSSAEERNLGYLGYFQILVFFFLFFKGIPFLFFYYLLIYLFLAVVGLRFCARAFSSCGERGPLFIAVCGPLSIAASLVAEHRL